MAREIERKWAVKSFPYWLPLIDEFIIEQIYIVADKDEEIRIRRKKNINTKETECTLTIKSNGDLEREENELKILESTYDLLASKYPKAIIKEQKTYLMNDYIAEVNFVDESFYYMEVEFLIKEEARKFVPNMEFALDVTDNKNYKMKNYWNKTRATKPIIELDIDGVIKDCYVNMNAEISEEFGLKHFNIYTAKSYDFSEYDEDVRETIFKKFENAEYMRNCPFTENGREFLDEIKKLVSQNKIILRINSLVFSKEIKYDRLAWLEEEFCGLQNVEINLPIGRTKPMLTECDITIEDSISNLRNSKSKKKLLISNFINSQEQNLEDSIERSDLNSAMEYIKKIIS